MQGLVPAAGEGTRLRPLTADRPKGLVHVGDRPLLAHVFETLVDLDVAELLVVVEKWTLFWWIPRGFFSLDERGARTYRHVSPGTPGSEKRPRPWATSFQ